jgi:hypothetical protein
MPVGFAVVARVRGARGLDPRRIGEIRPQRGFDCFHLAGWLLARDVCDLEYAIYPCVWVIGLAARGVVNHPPISTLREG